MTNLTFERIGAKFKTMREKKGREGKIDHRTRLTNMYNHKKEDGTILSRPLRKPVFDYH
jgi:hypothetical protein